MTEVSSALLSEIYGELRPLQKSCIDHFKAHPRCILDSYMGTGKTLMILHSVFSRKPKKVLINCGRNALLTWKKEIEKWFPELAQSIKYTVIKGTPAERRAQWASDSMFYVCTYAVMRNDFEQVLKIPFDALIMDEFHRAGLRKPSLKATRKKDPMTGKAHKTLTGYGYFNMLRNIPVIYPLSGTVLSKGPQDIWPVLHILDRQTFPSYWQFVNKFCVFEDGFFGKTFVGVKNTEEMARLVAPYWFKIPRGEAEKELPLLTKQLIPVEVPVRQRKMYDMMERDMYIQTTAGGIKATNTAIGKTMRLRQILACPKIVDVDSDDFGVGIETVVDKLLETGNYHAVIFTPFREAVTHFTHYLKLHLTPNVFHLWGGLDPEELHKRIAAWKKSKGVMVCTVAFSQSFELETASVCFFVGYEWDQNENDQASSRLRRLTSPGPIMAYYIQHQNTLDERVLEVLNSKRRITNTATQNFALFKQYLEEKYAIK